MTGLIRDQLARLARTIGELRERVRAAVAGEVGRAVGGAVREVVEAVAAGRPTPPAAAAGRWHDGAAGRWDDDPDDAWDDDPDAEDGYARRTAPDAGPAAVGVAAAVTAGVAAARLWAARTGRLVSAVGLGLGVGLLGVLGGPVARTAVAVLAATADLLAATAALGAGAARLDHL